MLCSFYFFSFKHRLFRSENDTETNYQLKQLRLKHMQNVCKTCMKKQKHCSNKKRNTIDQEKNEILKTNKKNKNLKKTIKYKLSINQV